ncbi:hypothetical protein FI667_g5963, partial [Globisporangium splendens]
MLARVVRSAAPLQASRSIHSSTAAAKAFQVPAAAASAPAPHVVSSGELAWCEIYGIDYEEQIQEALDEAPLLVSNMARAAIPSTVLKTTAVAKPSAAATTATSASAAAKGDIWNVVFGASTA